MNRRRLLMMAVAAAALTIPITRHASADVDGPCTATINGIDVASRSATSPDDAIRVGKHDVIEVVVESSDTIDHYDVQLVFAGFRWTVASDEADGTTWNRTVKVEDYSRFGAGLYQVRAVSTGGARCEGAVLIRVGGSPLATPAGWVALGATGLGLGAIVASARPRRPRVPAGAMALGALGGLGAILLAQQFGVFYPTRTVAAIGLATGLAAPFAVSKLLGRAAVPATPTPAPTPTPTPTPTPAATVPGWHADKVVPTGGLPSYDGPDLTAGPSQPLPAGMEVHVLEHAGNRVHVECSNGWRTWLDAHEVGAEASFAPPPPPA